VCRAGRFHAVPMAALLSIVPSCKLCRAKFCGRSGACAVHGRLRSRVLCTPPIISGFILLGACNQQLVFELESLAAAPFVAQAGPAGSFPAAPISLLQGATSLSLLEDGVARRT